MATSLWLLTMDFPARLIRLRKEKGLTQQVMADALGLNVTQVKRYESGASQPSLEALKKIALTLGVTTDFLLFENGERGPAEDLRLQFELVNQFDEEDRAIVKGLLEGMILKHEAKRWRRLSSVSSAAQTKAAKEQGGRKTTRRRAATRANA